MAINRRQFLISTTGFIGSQVLPTTGFSSPQHKSPWITPKGTIKIGMLWSLTGSLAVIEKPSRDVGLFWLEQVNKNGGIAGLRVEPVVIDAKSNMQTYRKGILELMLKEKVVAVFGGYTSASRRAVMPLVTIHKHLFYYPTCYEGRECWQYVICTGPIANQHSYDLIPYMVKNFGPRVYFVGSNYVWPKESNRNAKRWLDKVNGELVGEAYMPLGLGHFEDILKDIKNKQPDWIFSTVVGDSDLYFRQKYMKAGFTPDKLPTASLTTSEMEVKSMGYEFGEGHILSAPYFQSLDNITNKKFVDAFLNSPYGESSVTHYNMEETYLAFLYFQKAVAKIIQEEGTQHVSPVNIRKYSASLRLSAKESPEGEVMIDPDNFNNWLTPKIGRFDSQGQVKQLFSKEQNIKPDPFILYPYRGQCLNDGLHLPSGKVVKAAS